jgi:hypothetical protein
MSVRKSCYTCKNYRQGGFCENSAKCGEDMEYWEISEVYREAETVPVVTEHAEPEHDAVSKPKHYNQGGIECIEALKAATTRLTGIEAVCTANAIKYLWRWRDKNGAEDIRKAIWYCERLLKEIGDERKE